MTSVNWWEKPAIGSGLAHLDLPTVVFAAKDGIPVHLLKPSVFYKIAFALGPLEHLAPLDVETAVGLVVAAERWTRGFGADASLNKTLPKSLKAAGVFHSVLSKAIHRAMAGSNPRQIQERSESIAVATREFTAVFIAEIDDAICMAAEEETLGYNSKTLLSAAENILPADARTRLPYAAFRDFRLAGQCLIFDQWTAAAFHVLRATESTLIEYLKALGGTLPEIITWATLLRAIGTRKPPKHMMGRLDRLRDHERNALMHPGKFLTQDECWEVFDHCKVALSAILRELVGLNYVPPDPAD